jgi:hypothetical protein
MIRSVVHTLKSNATKSIIPPCPILLEAPVDPIWKYFVHIATIPPHAKDGTFIAATDDRRKDNGILTYLHRFLPRHFFYIAVGNCQIIIPVAEFQLFTFLVEYIQSMAFRHQILSDKQFSAFFSGLTPVLLLDSKSNVWNCHHTVVDTGKRPFSIYSLGSRHISNGNDVS